MVGVVQWWALVDALVRAVVSEMAHVLVHDGKGVLLVVDQQPVGALFADAMNEPFRSRIRKRKEVIRSPRGISACAASGSGSRRRGSGSHRNQSSSTGHVLSVSSWVVILIPRWSTINMIFPVVNCSARKSRCGRSRMVSKPRMILSMNSCSSTLSSVLLSTAVLWPRLRAIAWSGPYRSGQGHAPV